jgi:pyroglutamyl-peptidase
MNADGTLITGFLGFGAFPVNPSALLAQACGRRSAVIEVSFAAADQFVESLDPASFDRLLMLGVSARASKLQIERTARNFVDSMPDVRGVTKTRGPIEPEAPAALGETLFQNPRLIPTSEYGLSDDAGGYLCNYVFFRALRRFGMKRIGFVHVPPIELLALIAQQASLDRLIQLLEGDTQVAGAVKNVAQVARAVRPWF